MNCLPYFKQDIIYFT